MDNLVALAIVLCVVAALMVLAAVSFYALAALCVSTGSCACRLRSMSAGTASSDASAVRFARDPPMVSRDDDEWGTRLADVRVRSWYGAYPVVLALAALVGTLRKRRAWDEATDSLTRGRHAPRPTDGRRRQARRPHGRVDGLMAAMTERMEAYGRMSVRLAAASLAVAVAALVVAVVVAVAG